MIETLGVCSSTTSLTSSSLKPKTLPSSWSSFRKPRNSSTNPAMSGTRCTPSRSVSGRPSSSLSPNPTPQTSLKRSTSWPGKSLVLMICPPFDSTPSCLQSRSLCRLLSRSLRISFFPGSTRSWNPRSLLHCYWFFLIHIRASTFLKRCSFSTFSKSIWSLLKAKVPI